MRFDTLNVRSLQRSGSLTTVAMKLDLTDVQVVRWYKGGTVRVRDYNFFYVKGKEKHQVGTGYFV
jgi:hypothetical protein